ncbi:MAG: complex I NDUFA9 subunit family protein [Alphaproteobacteria bacterium]|nr:complex I NDUFA9 subunit family protein [Alphaproteobacteria bacterium]
MTTKQKTATIFGGTGFVGKQIVAAMGRAGWTVKIATRVPERGNALKPCGAPGQIVPVYCDYNDPESIADAVKGADYVVNCIGILFQKHKNGFQKAHAQIPESIAKACRAAPVKRFVHISALGVDKATSRYAATKRAGEVAVREAFPDATILRPSVIFGPEDRFFNMFAELARYVPVLPLIGGGKTKFQPVYVGDVAAAVMAGLSRADASGRTYELGGPEIVTFQEIYARLFSLTGRSRTLLSLPFWVAKIDAAFLSLFPTPLLTPDQVESLKTDTVVDKNALTFADLGVVPTGMNAILPGYLNRFYPPERFASRTIVE